jgi:hypothetical protein
MLSRRLFYFPQGRLSAKQRGASYHVILKPNFRSPWLILAMKVRDSRMPPQDYWEFRFEILAILGAFGFWSCDRQRR